MTNTNELTAKAHSTIGILENIAGYEPGDIDGDTVELRFENEAGYDTGCDVSLVEQCQNAADVIRALTEALEAADRRNAELNSTLERWATDRAQAASDLDGAEKRIVSLEARTLTVKLPDYRDTYKEAFASEVEHHVRIELGKLAAATGVKLQIEGE